MIQWFADTKAAEKDLLDHFFDFLKQYKTVVHFNGDGFDIPFLQKRCKHFNLPYSLSDVASFDIYKKIKPYRNLLGLDSLKQKSIEFDNIIKVGRTQLQDAVPMRLGQAFNAYRSAIDRDTLRLKKTQNELCIVNMGGTAIGTAINANPEYLKRIPVNLKTTPSFNMVLAEDLIDATQNLDAFVSVSGALKAAAVTLSKMANDFRLLSSGPKTGFAEINLPPKQNGSSIMPGKINPVIPEVVSQVAFNVIGNDLTITMAAEAGQLELNAFEPVLFYNLFESIETLTNGISTFIDNCITGITANEDRCEELLEHSIVTVTALCPYIGYKEASDIAKESILSGKLVSQIVREKGLLSQEELETILDPSLMTEPMEEQQIS